MFAALVPLLILVFLALGILVALNYRLFKSASAARQSLAIDLHSQALRLDQRCDYQQGELDRLGQRQRIDHLGDLVEIGANSGQLPQHSLASLRGFVQHLREESFSSEIHAREAEFLPDCGNPGGPDVES